LNYLEDITKVVNLTHSIHEGIQIFPKPWHKRVIFETLGRIQKVGRNTTQLHLGTHTGTHIDAPSHFIQDGKTISEIELTKFVGTAYLIDLTHLQEKHPVSIKDVESSLKSVPFNSILIFKFGWGSNFGLFNYYSHQPYFLPETAEYILGFKPKLIGYDLAMPDNPVEGFESNCDSQIHKIFLSKDVPLLENLYLNEIHARKFNIVALPLNLEGLDGSPVRCIGIL
jgi:arylformamidase